MPSLPKGLSLEKSTCSQRLAFSLVKKKVVYYHNISRKQQKLVLGCTGLFLSDTVWYREVCGVLESMGVAPCCGYLVDSYISLAIFLSESGDSLDQRLIILAPCFSNTNYFSNNGGWVCCKKSWHCILHMSSWTLEASPKHPCFLASLPRCRYFRYS